MDSAYRPGYLFVAVLILYMQDSSVKRGYHISKDTNIKKRLKKSLTRPEPCRMLGNILDGMKQHAL